MSEELIEFNFPSPLPHPPNRVKVKKIFITGDRALPRKVEGQTGFVHRHSTHHGRKWARVVMDEDGESYDFTFGELEILKPGG